MSSRGSVAASATAASADRARNVPKAARSPARGCAAGARWAATSSPPAAPSRSRQRRAAGTPASGDGARRIHAGVPWRRASSRSSSACPATPPAAASARRRFVDIVRRGLDRRLLLVQPQQVGDGPRPPPQRLDQVVLQLRHRSGSAAPDPGRARARRCDPGPPRAAGAASAARSTLALALLRRLTGDHLVQQRADRVDVAAVIDRRRPPPARAPCTRACPSRCPGSVRRLVRPALRATPKSSTLTKSALPSRATRKMFSGLRSRWITPAACAAASARQTWIVISTGPVRVQPPLVRQHVGEVDRRRGAP